MDDRQDGSNRIKVYPLPENTEKAKQNENFENVQPGPASRKRSRKFWLFAFPLVAWIACLGLAAYAVYPILPTINQAEIPVTGVDPTQTPIPGQTRTPSPTQTQAQDNPAPGTDFIDAAAKQMDTCSQSFHDYFVLEQIAIDNEKIFKDQEWRTDVTKAMQLFHDDCQSLGTLPAAPPAYADAEHWLKKAADEVEPATASFTSALDKDEFGQFRISIQHMIKFVDYIHNAENAINGMIERKQI